MPENTGSRTEMKKFLLALFAVLVSHAFCADKEKLPLVPYEFAGSKGFVNSSLETITMPVYSTTDWGNNGNPYTKYAAIAVQELGDTRFCYLVLYDGRKIKIEQDSGFVGEEYYYSNYKEEQKYAVIKSLWNRKESYTIRNVKIRPSPSAEWIIARDTKGAGDRIITLNGDVRWSSPDRYSISQICAKENLIFIEPNMYSCRMIDCSGNDINNSEWSYKSFYSEGLFASGRRVYSSKHPQNYFVTGDYGFYNREGKRIIPVADYKGGCPRSY